MEPESSFVSTSTVVSHPEHILLPDIKLDTIHLGGQCMYDTVIGNEIELSRLPPQLETELSFLMSESEIKEDERRLEEYKESLNKQKQYHDTWNADMKIRKLALMERIQKLNRFHRRRLVLFEDFKVHANDMKQQVRKKTDDEKEIENKTEPLKNVTFNLEPS